ncbi:related to PSD1-phosphatidylserine decarboxylase 1 [Sporisorium reilianum f. sp. reilianum]|uniref:Phosphatidylserine decarboxylase proenzyme 1, mitochondrial n=1 Tax=Sporisorium reilianum f. sp. reilianum TaxID=72559 RepID=A0A2N8UCD4_9BASI|nr:related to PSD1-phosphatidylserine decarboxylase 1 [Sporisorium reilianum f. sp. reilianum]
MRTPILRPRGRADLLRILAPPESLHSATHLLPSRRPTVASPSIATAIRLARPLSFSSKRYYSRNPLQAEHEANTVRGHRAARSRSDEQARQFHQSKQAGQDQNPSYKQKLSRSWSSTPIKWYPIPILLGAVVLVGVQARRNYVAEQNGKGVGTKIVDENGQVVKMQGPWTVYVIGALPLNAISRAWGWANNITLPVWFRPFGFKLYAYIFGCNLDEMKDPDLTHYKSLGEFFYRELKEGARPIDDSILVSPADGKVLHFGEIAGRRVEQVKGITYSLDALLGVTSSPEATENVVGKSIGDSDHERLDDRQFASVNGIDYTLDELLGDEKSKSAVPDPDETPKRKSYWKRFVKASYWKSWVKRTPAQSSNTTGVPASNAVDSSSDKSGDAADDDDNEDDDDEPKIDAAVAKKPKQIDDAGMPEPDTPEVLGRYANVAYEMGVSALPPLLQPHSPNQKGVKEGNKLFFCVIYLAPGDYHRFHSPTNWVAERRRHFRGELYSVSPYMARRLSNLFVLNERVALLGRWRHGFFGMVPVGATNVGSIRINFDKALRTNVRMQRYLAGTYSEASYSGASKLLGGQPLGAGDEMGGFLLGSTIVLVFEAPSDFRFDLKPDQKIKVGERLGDIREAAPEEPEAQNNGRQV